MNRHAGMAGLSSAGRGWLGVSVPGAAGPRSVAEEGQRAWTPAPTCTARSQHTSALLATYTGKVTQFLSGCRCVIPPFRVEDSAQLGEECAPPGASSLENVFPSYQVLAPSWSLGGCGLCTPRQRGSAITV